ncbi:hypothetical protein EMCG_00982 [[Emmonsia] crescens]|uniref:Uncharacterized protein n=1 Tax=[Emmonsia] crescens TaxID=73230 RepID=A0A0G2IE18_9EURO|nr:hypothetical protein EMCG_00982 [Emmonsia crescens UAMH 3008]
MYYHPLWPLILGGLKGTPVKNPNKYSGGSSEPHSCCAKEVTCQPNADCAQHYSCLQLAMGDIHQIKCGTPLSPNSCWSMDIAQKYKINRLTPSSSDPAQLAATGEPVGLVGPVKQDGLNDGLWTWCAADLSCSRDSDCMHFPDCVRLSGGDDSNIGCGAGVQPNSCWTWTSRPNVVN